MKKYRILLGIICISFLFCGCSTNKTPDSPESRYRQFLDDGIPDFSGQYAFWDMNEDDIPELCIKTPSTLTIFTIDNEQVTLWYEGSCYEMPLNDGTIYFEHTGKGLFQTTYKYFSLDSSGNIKKQICFEEYFTLNNKNYFINNQEVKENYYFSCINPHLNASDDEIQWYRLTDGEAMPHTGAVADDDAETEDMAVPTTFSFQANPSSPELTISLVFYERRPDCIKEIHIYEKDTNNLIQKMEHVNGNNYVIHPFVYFKDINFDGYLDFLIPYSYTGKTYSFSAYVWDEINVQFVKDFAFTNIENPILDKESNRVLSAISVNNGCKYAIYSYDSEGNLTLTHRLYWKKTETAGSIALIETHGETVVKDTTIPNLDYYRLPEDHADTEEYFVPGSLWDLKNEKWKNELVIEWFNSPLKSMDVEAIYYDFLAGNLSIRLREDKTCTIQWFLDKSIPNTPYEYAFYDISRDNVPELFVRTCYGTYIFQLIGDRLALWNDYSHDTLITSGMTMTASLHDAPSYTSYQCILHTMRGFPIQGINFAEYPASDTQGAKYYVNNVEVSEEVYRKYMEPYSNTEELHWLPLQ